MRIATRLLILFIVIAFAFGAFFYMFYHIKKEELRLYSEGDLYQRKLTIDSIFQMKYDAQLSLAEDYSIWEKMVQFISSRDVQWARRNLDTVIPVFGYSLVQVYDSKLELLYSDTSEASSGISDYRLEISHKDSLGAGYINSYHTRHYNNILFCIVVSYITLKMTANRILWAIFFLLKSITTITYLLWRNP